MVRFLAAALQRAGHAVSHVVVGLTHVRCQACRALFRGRATPSRAARARVASACAENSQRVQACARNQTKLTPPGDLLKYLPCCVKSDLQECRDSCRRALRNAGSQQEAIDDIIEGKCGPPLPQHPMWQCFLTFDRDHKHSQRPNVVAERAGVLDSAKLHCCQLAHSPRCRRLCIQTFGDDWSRSWEQFDDGCLAQTSEDAMRRCVDEVEEPCELGCDGLSFCSNFNNRPIDLFRSCNQEADEAARHDIALWNEQGFLALPGVTLPLKNMSTCLPDAWQAVACALQLKPCSRSSHVDRICREDCLDLLTRCTDWARAPPGLTAAGLCNTLSPDEPKASCVALRPYLEPNIITSSSPSSDLRELVTSPCRGSPCGSSRVCSVSRCPGALCSARRCLPGCPLGEASHYAVPEGTLVRVPMDGVHGQQKGCLKICRCGNAGVLTDCQPLPCVALDSCSLAGRRIEHGSSFYVECNLCSCYAGEIVCGKRKCARRVDGIVTSSSQNFGTVAATLPCDCPPHYVPVCGADGNTYANPCLAKCAGIGDGDVEFGPCGSRDACADHQCRSNQVCLPRRTVCLSALHRPCLQYECVNKTNSCGSSLSEPVCDTAGREHSSVCGLLASGSRLAYWGPCLTGCSSHSGPVCGFNGVTYRSECAAHADYSSVDYNGPCLAVGLIGDSINSAQCGLHVVCKPLEQADCEGYIPPGACCPICAGAVRILYSRKQIDRALYALRGPAQSHLTLYALLKALERQIQVAQCSLRGYLSPESDLFVTVQTNVANPSRLQLDACAREADKLAALVRTRSPRIASELTLSALTAAREVHRDMSAGSIGASLQFVLVLTLYYIDYC
ncbi:reversion-inducing cysteine-rich protein with Kazal motifs-like [Ctenocephalides felis]|uniref:reversion-inducing cysteine-rich protein with Kazal motifs-like n=1 Tax=Ctenocephalides felis TaxID=7515 RepID=UPI000E6E491D|nr:reversion-inducing cysteine-rich protein with Kazal motifs-like [Ctenocephalides felis]